MLDPYASVGTRWVCSKAWNGSGWSPGMCELWAGHVGMTARTVCLLPVKVLQVCDPLSDSTQFGLSWPRCALRGLEMGLLTLLRELSLGSVTAPYLAFMVSPGTTRRG